MDSASELNSRHILFFTFHSANTKKRLHRKEIGLENIHKYNEKYYI